MLSRIVLNLQGAGWVLGSLCLCAAPSCWDHDPCDPGQILVQNMCRTLPDAGAADRAAAPAEAAAGSDATSADTGGGSDGALADGASAADGSADAPSGGRPKADEYSYKACQTSSDCGGQTPLCPTRPIPPSSTNYCTLLECSTDDDPCPEGGHCTSEFNVYNQPNLCKKDE